MGEGTIWEPYIFFVAGRLSATTKCQQSAASLNKASDGIYANREKLIDIKIRHSLIKPSVSLFKLLSTTENCVLGSVRIQPLSMNFLNEILCNLDQKILTFIGCKEYCKSFTNTAVQYYIVLRLCFICKRENDIDENKKRKRQQYKKNFPNFKIQGLH